MGFGEIDDDLELVRPEGFRDTAIAGSMGLRALDQEAFNGSNWVVY